MQGFIRTLSYLLAGLCVLLIAAGISTLIGLRGRGDLSPENLRKFVLSEEEQQWLKERAARPPEPAEHKPEVHAAPGAVTEDELLTRIAERANADRATQVIEELRRRRLALDERQAWLDQQHAEMALAKGDLERLRRQLDASRQTLEEERKAIEDDRAKWAAAQVQNTAAVQSLGEAEQVRYQQQAKLYEQMKDAAWQSLKRFEPKEIAKYLALMEQKKAAKLLTVAENDKTLPEGFTTSIHRELLKLDLSRKSSDQVQRLATLYGFMKGPEVAGYLTDSSPEECADILLALGESQTKKRAEILEAVRTVDADKAIDIQRQLLKKLPAGPVQ
jgi:flagellar motility protein MotE (MotC chaperone)